MWQINPQHKAHKQGGWPYNNDGTPIYAPLDPNYRPNAIITQAEQEDGFGLANYGVILRYKIKIYNDAIDPKSFRYVIEGDQNIIVQGTINGVTMPAESRGDFTNNPQTSDMFITSLEPGENIIILEVILSTGNSGGLPNHFYIDNI